MKRMGKVAVTMCVAALVYACGGDDDDATAGSDPGAACTSLCTDSGFTSGRADVQSNETNCFCTGGAGNVTAPRCTTLCNALKKATATPFNAVGGAGSTGCSCQ